MNKKRLLALVNLILLAAFIVSLFQPRLLPLSLILIVLTFLIDGDGKMTRVLLYVTAFFIVGQYMIIGFYEVRNRRPVFILRNSGLSYDKKMEMSIGKIPYDYAMFIKNNTPVDAVILIPPQGYPWDKTSNEAYLRYFLYPRKLVNGNEKDPRVDIKNVDYVLIDYGETNISQYGFTNVWPKFNVNGEYIIYWNSQDGTTRRIDNSKYVYKAAGNEEWGIVRVKK